MLFDFNFFVGQSFNLCELDVITRCFVKIKLFLAVGCDHSVDIIISFEAGFGSLDVPPLLMGGMSDNGYTCLRVIIYICLLIESLKCFFPTFSELNFFNLIVGSVGRNISYILELIASLWNLTVNHFLISNEPSFNESEPYHTLANWISHLSVRAIKWHSFSASNHESHILIWFDDVLINGFSNQFESLFHRSDWLPHQIVVSFQFSVICNSIEVVVLSQRLVFSIKNAINFLQFLLP
jgi:hypothetical protein